MEVVILDRNNLSVKGFYHTSSFHIIPDLLVPQISSFTISALEVNGNYQDIIITRDKNFKFMGVINTIEPKDDRIVIGAYSIKKLLEIDIISDSYTGNMGDFIAKQITDNLINTEDSLQNIDYLSVENQSVAESTIPLDNTKTISLIEIIENIINIVPIVIDYDLVYTNTGLIKGIKFVIKDNINTMTIKEDLSCINDVEIIDGSVDAVNKIIFVPEKDNILFTEKQYFYLLNDGTITQDATNLKRILPVIYEIVWFPDKEAYYTGLESLALEEFAKTTYNHCITFTMNKNAIFDILNLKLGDRINFITKNGKTYISMITKMEFTDTFDSVKISLGFNRKSLTDKLYLTKKEGR